MRIISTTVFALFLSLNLIVNANAEESIEDRDAWLQNAVAMIESGRLFELQNNIKSTLGVGMEDDVEELMEPLMSVMEDHKAVYVDKINHIELGQSFDQHVYAAYYGEREFLFYSFTFARLENGWQLFSLDFADSVDGLDAPSN